MFSTVLCLLLLVSCATSGYTEDSPVIALYRRFADTGDNLLTIMEPDDMGDLIRAAKAHNEQLIFAATHPNSASANTSHHEANTLKDLSQFDSAKHPFCIPLYNNETKSYFIVKASVGNVPALPPTKTNVVVSAVLLFWLFLVAVEIA
ncbi:hypothetical protein ADEAN_000884800 [Angomonas deanei]|uniref:Uncharacterized protein n=1 Tax=Angomonas deanei TaxID=59799 RepID=A0A7G2CN99_9TRYP|nr:hypothetical protein ADEAN_000884800 [Angomonas deanei]